MKQKKIDKLNYVFLCGGRIIFFKQNGDSLKKNFFFYDCKNERNA